MQFFSLPYLAESTDNIYRRMSDTRSAFIRACSAMMARKQRHASGLADPVRLKSIDPDNDDLVVVVIETPKGSRNKYAYDPTDHIFELKKVLPAGMAFPYDFGFVPSTLGGDGDPLDVLVLMDEPAFPGCKLKSRIVGIIEGEESDKKISERNDRVIAIENANHSYARVTHVDDLGKEFEKELEEFFVNYHRLSGKSYKILSVKGPRAGYRAVKDAQKAAR
jgi:inorganic pyrophosphatase